MINLSAYVFTLKGLVFMLIKLFAVRVLGNLVGLFQEFQQQRARVFIAMFAVGFTVAFALTACSGGDKAAQEAPASNPTTAQSGVVIRIGYQKAATVLYALKAKGDLEKAFAASGATVTWSEFPAGPPMLEAVNAGSIDFGYTGEAPPIFAQAGDNPFVYVAYDPWGAKAEGIIVPKNSNILKVADLKGKKVAFAKGSNTNYLVVKALEKAGLQYSDIQPAFLTPADARVAFEGGNVDAWAIWDPFLAAAEKALAPRLLIDATGLAPNRGYFLAAKAFAEKNPEGLKTVLGEVKKVSDWAKNNSSEVAKLLSAVLGIDAAVLETAEKRREYDVLPLTEEVIQRQQEIADTFYRIKLIPKQINVKEAVWQGNK
ncbi:ABC transporter, substrate-binding protein, aliphatic sulphonates [Calothrix sp. PCC 7716]|nr:ABC transporter, substrate-binding protein, aliphatic sulphonates [Calothrix sp. PCC 7716]